MAKMCPMGGCKQRSGMCVHDKLMLVMVILGGAAAVAHWALQII